MGGYGAAIAKLMPNMYNHNILVSFCDRIPRSSEGRKINDLRLLVSGERLRDENKYIKQVEEH